MGFYGLFVALILCASVLSGAIGYTRGANSRNPEIVELTAAIEASKRIAADAEARAAKVGERVVIEYRDRVRTIRESAPAEIQLVEVIRESGSNCMVPAEFIRLWNGPAPSGGEEAKSSVGTDGAPVTLADVAETAAEARARFEINSAKLEALQAIVSNQ